MKEAILYSKNPDKSVSCFLCNRFCHIPEDERGFCGVRKNMGGTLYPLNYGKAIAVAMDPIEKKPFYHFMPGTRTLSFATVGCNFRCLYCFTPDTAVINDDEPKYLEELFESCGEAAKKGDAEIIITGNKKTIAHSGNRKNIIKAFRHRYEGYIHEIRPRHAPPIKCTPEHGIYVYENGSIEKKKAHELKKGDWLLVPKLRADAKKIRMLNVKKILGQYCPLIRKSRKTDKNVLENIMKMKKNGSTSREIAARFGMHPVYIRKLWGQIEKTGITEGIFFYENEIVEDGGKIRFKTEKRDGIPKTIRIDEKLAELLGYFCAEGSICKDKKRPNSFALVFSFGKHEKSLVERTAGLIRQKFGLAACIREIGTTLIVEASKSSIAVLFMYLCGKGAKNKKVPACISSAGKSVIRAFLRAFIAGDGAIMRDSIAVNTVSKKLALGVYHLFLLCGYLPSFYTRKPPRKKRLGGRTIRQSTIYYVKLRAEKFRKSFLSNGKKILPRKKSEDALKFKETKTHWLVPVFKIAKRKYSGYVYNMEVEGEHSYLANFIGVANCQNWDISQALRERGIFGASPDLIPGEDIPPEKMVKMAEEERADGIAYTYTEPTIFMEYALDTARLAKAKKMFNIFVTNGYMSPAAIREMEPLIDASRIDLKGFNQKIYTDVVGNAKLEAVLQSIKALHGIMHIEIINLVIPGMNDSEDELHALSRWVADLDKNIPVHFIGFYPSYKMMDVPSTPLETLRKARGIAIEEGVRYAYTGNRVDAETESTYCYNCKTLLVRRFGFEASEIKVTKDSKCPECGKKQYFVMDMEKYWKGKK